MGEEEVAGGGGGGGSRSFAPFDQVLRNEMAMQDAAMVAQYSLGMEEDTVDAKKWTGMVMVASSAVVEDEKECVGCTDQSDSVQLSDFSRSAFRALQRSWTLVALPHWPLMYPAIHHLNHTLVDASIAPGAPSATHIDRVTAMPWTIIASRASTRAPTS